jgi:hypothetical protein
LRRKPAETCGETWGPERSPFSRNGSLDSTTETETGGRIVWSRKARTWIVD